MSLKLKYSQITRKNRDDLKTMSLQEVIIVINICLRYEMTSIRFCFDV